MYYQAVLTADLQEGLHFFCRGRRHIPHKIGTAEAFIFVLPHTVVGQKMYFIDIWQRCGKCCYLSGFCRVPSLLCSGNLVSAKQANMPELINAKIVLTISTQYVN